MKRVSSMGPSAMSWLIRTADEDNHPAANYALGVCYHDGYVDLLGQCKVLV